MNTKKSVLIIISLLIVASMGLMVSSLPDVFFNGTIANITNRTVGTTVGAYAWGVSDVFYMRSGDWLINYSIGIFNTSADLINASALTVTMPAGWTIDTSGYNVSVAHGVNITGLTGTVLLYNHTNGSSATPVNNIRENLTFLVNGSFATAGTHNITLALYNGSTVGVTDILNYTIPNRLVIDDTAPVISSAATYNTTGINVTFTGTAATDAMNGTPTVPNEFNVTWDNETYDVLAALPGPDGYVRLILYNYTPTNATPTVGFYTNNTGASVQDYAGNTMVNKSASVTASDGVAPYLVWANYTHDTRIIQLIFSEEIGSTIDDLNLVISNGVNSLNLTTTSSTATYENQTNITLTAAQRDEIASWRNVSVYITTLASLVADQSSNNNNITYNMSMDAFGNDTIQGQILSATFNANTNNLTIIFNETINTSDFDVSEVYIHNTTDSSASDMNLTIPGATVTNNGTVVYGDTTFEIYIKLTASQLDRVNNQTASALWLAFDPNVTVRDLAGNYISRNVTNATGQYVTLTASTSVVGLLKGLQVNGTVVRNSTGIAAALARVNLITGENWRIDAEFNKTMDETVPITGTFTPASGSATTFNGTWKNNTHWTGYLNITTSSGDGQGAIAISGGQDLQGNLMGTINNLTYVYIDTVAPYIVFAYYSEEGAVNAAASSLNGTQEKGDQLVLVMSENMTAQAEAGFNMTNLTLVGGVSNGTTYRVVNDKVYINMTNYTSVDVPGTLTLRGQTTVNLWANSTAAVIKDDSGIGVVNNTDVVVADYAITLTNGTGNFTSLPYCLNTTLMEAHLNATGTTVTFYYYSSGRWQSDGIHQLIPLKGYKIVMDDTTKGNGNSTQDLLVYANAQANCNIENLNLTVSTGGWALLGVDGIKRLQTADNATDSWLNSLTIDQAGTGVTHFADSTGVTLYNELGGAGYTDWDGAAILPYTAWWTFIDSAATSTKAFAGRGQK